MASKIAVVRRNQCGSTLLSSIKWCSPILYHLVAQGFQDTWRKSGEEELDVLSNQRKLCCKHCACVVVLQFHVLSVVSGGGHRRQSKTEVSYDFIAMKTFFTTLFECEYE